MYKSHPERRQAVSQTASLRADSRMSPRESMVMPTALYAEQVLAEFVEEKVLTMRELKEAFRLDIYH